MYFMKKHVIYLFGLFFMLVFCNNVNAQTGIKITYLDQTVQSFSIADKGKLYFNTTDLIVSTNGVTNTNIPINIIQKITFDANALGTETFEMANEQWLLYPNPVLDTFQISSAKETNHFQVQIFNLNGKQVHKGIYNNNQIIDISYLNAGVYIAKVNNVSLKFIKK